MRHDGIRLYRSTSDRFYLRKAVSDIGGGGEPEYIAFPEAEADALVAVAEAAQVYIGPMRHADTAARGHRELHAALDALTAARGPHEAKGDGE